MRNYLRPLFLLFVAACAAETEDDDGKTADGALVADYDTPDANNIWTRGVDLSRLTVGEETILPNEEAMFAGFAQDIESMQDRLSSVNGQVARGFHAKAHACVQGTFKAAVPASLPRAKVGLFANDTSYAAWVRFSNGTGFVQSDKSGDVRGLAIKVVMGNGVTQDFLMTNGATTPASDSRQFVNFGKALTDARVDANGGNVGTIEGMLKTGGYLFKGENKRVREFLLTKAIPRVLAHGTMLGEQFWTGGAFAMGVDETGKAKQAAKMTALPGVMRNGSCVAARGLPNVFDENYFRNDLISRMKQSDTCIVLAMQFQSDPKKQPIEDTSVEWKERDSAFTTVGYVTIPKIDLEANQRAESFCNELGFTPWHNLPEHRPLGNIMRARKPVYAASHDHRGGAPGTDGRRAVLVTRRTGRDFGELREELLVDVSVRGDDGALLDVVGARAEVGHATAGREHDGSPRRDVPWPEVPLPVALVGAIGDETQIQRRGATSTHGLTALFDGDERIEVVLPADRSIVRKPRGEERFVELGIRAGSTRRPRARGLVGRDDAHPFETERGRDDDAHQRHAVLHEADRHAEEGVAVHEIRRAVERVDEEHGATRDAGASCFFADDGMNRFEPRADERFAVAIELGHEIDAALVLDDEVRAIAAHQERGRLAGDDETGFDDLLHDARASSRRV